MFTKLYKFLQMSYIFYVVKLAFFTCIRSFAKKNKKVVYGIKKKIINI